MADSPTARSGFRSVLRIREFRLLWLADAQSMLGDQLARVALAVLVFDRTHSGLATVGVYALTFLPALFAGLLLGHLADRLPGRELLVVGDVLRAVLLLAMALPGCPLWLMAVLVVVVVLIETPWKAAEQSLIVDLVPADDYAVGIGLRTATVQAAQLVGFGVGGIVVAALAPRPALAVDAVTFLLSAIVIHLGIAHRPAAASGADGPRTPWWQGSRAILGDRRLRVLLEFSWLLGLLVVPEGLAAPYAAHLDGSATATGLILAAGPAGVLIGSLVVSRLLTAGQRAGWLTPMAVVAGLPLVTCVADPPLPIVLALFAVSGVFLAYQNQIVVEFVAIVPASIRAQGIAVASSALLAAQGVGMLVGGAVDELTSVQNSVAITGGAATVLAVVLGARRHALRTAEPRSIDLPSAASTAD